MIVLIESKLLHAACIILTAMLKVEIGKNPVALLEGRKTISIVGTAMCQCPPPPLEPFQAAILMCRSHNLVWRASLHVHNGFGN